MVGVFKLGSLCVNPVNSHQIQRRQRQELLRLPTGKLTSDGNPKPKTERHQNQGTFN